MTNLTRKIIRGISFDIHISWPMKNFLATIAKVLYHLLQLCISLALQTWHFVFIWLAVLENSDIHQHKQLLLTQIFSWNLMKYKYKQLTISSQNLLFILKITVFKNYLLFFIQLVNIKLHYIIYKMSIQKIFISLLVVVLLLLSSYYENYSRDQQLFNIHHIPRGSLKLTQKLSQTITDTITKINSPYNIQIKMSLYDSPTTVNKWRVCFNRIDVFLVKRQNFISIIKAQGTINAHGDSFYKIREEHIKFCHHQVISQINPIEKGIQIKGKFSDCEDSNYIIRMSKVNGKQLQIKASFESNKYNRILLYFEHKKQNNYFGLGEQFSNLNLGQNRPYSLFVREKGVGRTEQPETFLINWMYGAGGSYYNSYSPTPIWMSSEFVMQSHQNLKSNFIGYILNSWAYAVWMNNHILVWDRQIQIKIFKGDSVKQTLKMIAEFNGYTPPVPDWVNQGAIVGLQGGTQAVMKKYTQLKKAGTKISGLWLQDWVSKRRSLGYSRLWWNWQLDEDHYKGWHQMRQQLQKQNVSLLIYMNPMLTNVEGKKKNYTTNYYKKAKQLSYFIKNKEGKDFQTSAFSDWTASMIDFSNKQAKEFYKKILRNAIKDSKARGLMIDFGQAFPVENMNCSLENATKLHNKYPSQYHEVAREVFNQFKDQKIYTFSRAGYLFAPKYTLSLWAGDQSMNFKKNTGLSSCLTAMLSSSLVGYSNTHCDIGGYTYFQIPFRKTSVRTQILMTRWMQLGAFSPVFRTHQGNLPEKSIQVYSNASIACQFAFYSHIFNSLSGYRKNQALLSQQQKIPLIRPMFIQNQNDPEVYKISDQYYIGSDILVSPILTPQNKRKLYVPRGDWINIWTNKPIQGCDCYIQSNQFLPTVIIKKSSPYKQQIINKIASNVKHHRNCLKYLSNVQKSGEEL